VIDEEDQASDQALALRAAAGGREAFAELVARHTRGLHCVLRAALRDRHRSEDLAQEVWIKVFGALPRYRPAGSFRSWLYSIALNHLRDALRHGRVRQPPPTPDVEGLIDEEARQPAERRDEVQRVQRVVADLAEPFRTALTLVDLAGLSYAEAAATCGCSLGTVKSRVHRARLAFRDAWVAGQAPIPPVRSSPDWRPSP
jgi:RNA polymerase sigma-70 factor (ECF subfamily)